MFSVAFFFLASDIFVMLRYIVSADMVRLIETISSRVYAITSKNRIIAVYLGTLVLAKLITNFITGFLKPPSVVPIPPIPLDFFNMCTMNVDLHLMVIPNSIGTVFGT